MSDVLDHAGFALRKNGTCLDTEVDCGATAGPFRACCPAGSFCPSQYNVNCCPSAANCTQVLEETPKCANETWNLYNWYGYFCCENGTVAFGTSSQSDGCALPDYTFDKSSETLLPIVSSGKVATSTSSVTATSTPTPSTTSTSSTSPTQTSAPSKASKTNTGAIAGGVVGGVAGVALLAVLGWWLFSRRTKRQGQRQPVLHEPQVVPVTDYKHNTRVMSELDARSAPQELEGQTNPHELPADSTFR